MSKPTSPQEPGLLQALDQYWFGFGSPVTLGVFRIMMGTLILINLLMIGAFWETWFSEKGFIPAWMGQLWLYPSIQTGSVDIPRINLLNGLTDPRITAPIYLLITLSALTTALGLWTRVSTFILGVGIVSLHHRNAAILHGGDTVMRVMALYLMLAPCGNACSLDRLIALWKGTAAKVPETVSLWPQRLIAYNVALLYLTTFWLKYWGNHWLDGTATWYPARLAEFYRFPVPAFLNELPIVKVTTYATLASEFALGTLVFFRPLRFWVLLSGVLLHLYIDYSMNIPLFSWIMMSTYVAFYEGQEISAWAKRVGRRLERFRVKVLLPKGQQLGTREEQFLQAVDPFGLVEYATGSDAKWHATRADGREISVATAIRTRAIGLWVFGWLPGVWPRIWRGLISA